MLIEHRGKRPSIHNSGIERMPDGSVDMKEITRRLVESLEEHRRDRILD